MNVSPPWIHKYQSLYRDHQCRKGSAGANVLIYDYTPRKYFFFYQGFSRAIPFLFDVFFSLFFFLNEVTDPILIITGLSIIVAVCQRL